MKEDNTMFYQAIGNSIQENKDKIEKLEKQNKRLKKKNKSLQSQLKEKEEVIKEAREYNQNIVDDYLKEDDCEYCDGRYVAATHNLEILSKYKEIVEEKHEIQNK